MLGYNTGIEYSYFCLLSLKAEQEKERNGSKKSMLLFSLILHRFWSFPPLPPAVTVSMLRDPQFSNFCFHPETRPRVGKRIVVQIEITVRAANQRHGLTKEEIIIIDGNI